MFNLDGQVLENPTNPFLSIRSRDTGQRDICFQDEAVSPSVRAEPACDQGPDMHGRVCIDTPDNLFDHRLCC